MTQLLRKEDPALYPQFRERILRLDAHIGHIGGGMAIIFSTKSICSKRSRQANESGLH